MTSLAPHMEAFLREHLVRHRGASPHTCDSYAYSFQSLFEFASKKLKAAPSALMLEQLDAALISSFLEHLETTRGNSAETRNIRLAAFRSFYRFLQHREPAAVEQVRRVLAIPFKKTDTRLVPHLVQEEMQARGREREEPVQRAEVIGGDGERSVSLENPPSAWLQRVNQTCTGRRRL